MDQVKDRTRIEEEVLFTDGTKIQELIHELEEDTTMNKCKREQKKLGGSLITTSFQVHLQADGKWDRWVVELASNLKIILGAQVIPLSYVICDNDTPDQTEH